ncbi:MAG: TRAP transporter large permease subunit, partial [Verrucomicrobiota bacterium]
MAVLLISMALIQVIELLGRFFNTGIPGALDYLQHLTLWVAFIGAMAATRADKHIKIGNLIDRLPEKARKWATLYGFAISAAVCASLGWAGVRLVIAEAPAAPEWLRPLVPETFADELFLFEEGGLAKVGNLIPIWIAEIIIPIGFFIMAVRFILTSSKRWKDRLIVSLGLPVALALAWLGPEIVAKFIWPAVIALLVGAVFGAPIFVVLAGASMLLFFQAWEPIASVPSATYEIVVSNIFPTIPIFTLLGFILSESKASERLARVFRALFGWVPGGTAVSATLVCAFFTTFTGASGVTILALGGLLLPVLTKNRYSESFSVGLLTSNGSMGLLLPPSLVVFLYGIAAQQPIKDMFIATLVPGLLMLFVVVVYCVIHGLKSGAIREKFDLREALGALRGAA